MLTLDIRQNNNEDFISVIKCNDSGVYRLNNETEFEGVTILSFAGACSLSYYRAVRITVSLQSEKCVLDFDTSASMICLFFNGSETFNTAEKNIYSIQGIYQFDHISILSNVRLQNINWV